MISNNQWVADNGDGTYTNPILYTDYSDPDVCRVGDDYFMTASSFCNAPGLPVLHSCDLVNWELIGYALDRVPGEQYDLPLHGCGVWAPAIRYHDGEFIIFFPMPDEGIYVVKTRDPYGKWDEPYCLKSIRGWIDPCPFWDEDGRAYMVCGVAKSRIGYKSILKLTEMTPDCTQLVGEERDIFDGNVTGQVTIEGPKLYKRNGWYYIFAPAGGVKQGWQTVLRSRSIWGPYEYRVVMLQKDTLVNGPHQGAWVDTVTGEDWFLHFQDVYAAGRITHLQPMRWVDDWPVIGEQTPEEIAAGEPAGKPVTTYAKPRTALSSPVGSPDGSDEFDTPALGLQWQWNANPQAEWYTLEDGKLYLRAAARRADTVSNEPNLLLQKWFLPEFRAETKLDLSGLRVGDHAGLISMGIRFAAVEIFRAADGCCIRTIDGKQEFQNERASASDHVAELETTNAAELCLAAAVRRIPSTEINSDGPYAFPIPAEEIELFYSTDGTHYRSAITLPSLAGRWVGMKIGLYCMTDGETNGGEAAFDYFRFTDLTTERTNRQ